MELLRYFDLKHYYLLLFRHSKSNLPIHTRPHNPAETETITHPKLPDLPSEVRHKIYRYLLVLEDARTGAAPDILVALGPTKQDGPKGDYEIARGDYSKVNAVVTKRWCQQRERGSDLNGKKLKEIEHLTMIIDPMSLSECNGRCRPFNHGRDQSCAMISHLRHHAFLIENHFQTLTIDCSDTDQLIMTFPYIIAIFRASTQPLRLVLKLRNGLGEITPGGLNRGVRVGGYTGGRGRLVVGGGGCQTVVWENEKIPGKFLYPPIHIQKKVKRYIT